MAIPSVPGTEQRATVPKPFWLPLGLSTCLLLIVCVACGFILFPNAEKPYLAVEMTSSVGSYAKLSVSYVNNGAAGHAQALARVAADPESRTYRFSLPYGRIDGFQFRPIASPGSVRVSAMTIHDAAGRQVRTIRPASCDVSNKIPVHRDNGALVVHFKPRKAIIIAKLQEPVLLQAPKRRSKGLKAWQPATVGGLLFCLSLWLGLGPFRRRCWACRRALYFAIPGVGVSMLNLSGASGIQMLQALLLLVSAGVVVLYLCGCKRFAPPPIGVNIAHMSSLLSCRSIGLFIVLPVALYFIVCVCYTFPIVDKVSSHVFFGSGDGAQTVWYVWWVRQAVIRGHNPWYTHMLFHPSGVSLLGATLHPLKGFMAVPLRLFFSLTESVNMIILLSFLVAGLTAFWLAYAVSRSYAGSLAAGFFFSFYNYHFAHLQGHLNLVSYEFLPVFILSFLVLLSKPRLVWGILSGVLLFLIILCDYYYFAFAVAAAVLLYLYQAWAKRSLLFGLRKPYVKPLLAGLTVSLLTAGLIAAFFIAQILASPSAISQGHNPAEHSLDLLNPIVPGFHWYFATRTQALWQQCIGNVHENSVHLGLALIVLLLAAWFIGDRKRLAPYYVAAAVFLLLSFGPYLHVLGHRLEVLHLPYRHLVTLLPVAGISGMPVRMILMVMLFAAVIAACAINRLLQRKAYVAVALLLGLAVFEYLPRPPATMDMSFRPRLWALRRARDTAHAVVDLTTLHADHLAMREQICHGKPIISGAMARKPQKQQQQYIAIRRLIHKQRWRELLNTYKVRYVISHKEHRFVPSLRQYQVLYQDKTSVIFDLMQPIEGE